MQKKLLGKIAVGTLAFSLFGSGVYAGTVIKSYKTPRGDIATVEKEEVHKNRIALEVDGKKVKKSTLYLNQTTYVPLRDSAEILGADVTYDSKTMSAKITTPSLHNKPTIIESNKLPYSFNFKDNSGFHVPVTINSVTSNEARTVVNVTITNKGNKASNMARWEWRMYENNNSVSNQGVDDYLATFLHDIFKYLPSGQTITGDLYFNPLPAGQDTIKLVITSSYGGEGTIDIKL